MTWGRYYKVNVVFVAQSLEAQLGSLVDGNDTTMCLSEQSHLGLGSERQGGGPTVPSEGTPLVN